MIDRKRLCEDFIRKAKLVQDKEYDYSKVEYFNNKIKVCIICPIHGEFTVRPNDFLNGHMCKYCGLERRIKKRTMKKEDFINKVKEKFPQYDLSLVNYKNSTTRVEIICPIHGKFKAMPYHLLNGHGCKKCGQVSTHNKQRKSIEKFKEEAKAIHGNDYDYSKSKYIDRYTSIEIICHKKDVDGKEHGSFWVPPFSHLRARQGCPICSETKLEKEIRIFLSLNKIEYEYKKHFEWLGKQHLDFYLPKYNVAIECQGIQHFEEIEFFGGKQGLIGRIERDNRKKRLCKENNIILLYYSSFEYDGVYTDKNMLINRIKNEH